LVKDAAGLSAGAGLGRRLGLLLGSAERTKSIAVLGCLGGSKIGTVEVRTPLLPKPLEGFVYLAAQNENPFGSLVAMYIVAEDPVSGVLVKLAGKVEPNPVTGQMTTTFDNNPQLPFSDFKLYFFGGARGALATPESCGTYRIYATFTPWSGWQRSQLRLGFV
jgi:hypothetical protein